MSRKLSDRILAHEIHWLRHYKGGEYSVFSVGTHTETSEPLVIYHRSENGLIKETWVRPLSMFDDLVEHEGEQVPRFISIPQPT